MDTVIAILAGGRGERLGGDKAVAELGGRPLISHPLDAAREAGGDVLVVAKPDTSLPELGPDVRIVREPPEPHHPICGLVAALREAGGAPVLAVAADMPFVTPDLLRWMASLTDLLAVPELGGRLHPLLALYRPELLGDLEGALAAEAPLQETVRALEPRTITDEDLSRFGDPARLLSNVNTPEELRAAEAGLP